MWAMLAVVAVAVAACSSPEETSGGVSASVPAAEPGAIPVTVEQEFGPATVDTPPRRVAAMGVGDGDNLLALGVVPVAFATFSQSDPNQLTNSWNVEAMGDATPTILPATSTDFGAEIPRTLATDPDLVTAIGAEPTRDQYNSLSKAAPTILRQSQYPAWLVPWDAAVRQVGTAVGLPDLAQRKIDETNTFLAGVRADNPEFAGKKAVVVVFDGTSVSVFGPKDGRAQTVADYGFTFPAELGPAITDGFYGTLSPERYDLLDSADVIVALDTGADGNARLQADPSFSRLDVAREGRVVYVSQEVGNGMSLPNLLTIPWVAEQMVGPIAEVVE
ncbi:ABC transporter substrate-binding protein [Gordonia sp. NPDC127522]|uniref:ABC transporter substrate-binding protein n=1 Tax=Gordonia sp. NPDC127522 TaxID=3345390 RepID=UPI00362C2411